MLPTMRPLAQAPNQAQAQPLDELLNQARIWRGDGAALPPLSGRPTGFDALDAALPGKGWPLGALTEIFPVQLGIGEVSIVLPALAHITREGGHIAWVMPTPAAPPGEDRHAQRTPQTGRQTGPRSRRTPKLATPHTTLFAPALAQAGLDLHHLLLIRPTTPQDALWATRQLIASNAFGAVVSWLDTPDTHSLRRLQIAAEGSHTLAILFRPARHAEQPSIAVLKLHIAAHAFAPGRQLAVSVLKRRGAPLAQPVLIDLVPPLPAAPASPTCFTPEGAHVMDRPTRPRASRSGVLPC